VNKDRRLFDSVPESLGTNRIHRGAKGKSGNYWPVVSSRIGIFGIHPAVFVSFDCSQDKRVASKGVTLHGGQAGYVI
jgi:hypothetical protein